MLDRFESDFKAVFGAQSHVLVAEHGATSYLTSDPEEDEDEECLLDDEDYYADDQEFFDLQELDFD